MLIFSSFISAEKDDSLEDLYRRAISLWQSSGGRNFQSFHTLAQQLEERFNDAKNNVLEMIGALEEGILVMERYMFEQDQGKEDPKRDSILSEVYIVYVMALLKLTAEECLSLANVPHALLIGADTVTEPSTKVCTENADNSAQNAATLDDTNQKAEQSLNALNANSVHEQKPKEFVAELFESFASTFDKKLLENLEYRVPQLVGKLAQQLLSSTKKNKKHQHAMDAGCGTGLAGCYLRPLVENSLVGVDASQKMLDITEKCTIKVGCGLE